MANPASPITSTVRNMAPTTTASINTTGNTYDFLGANADFGGVTGGELWQTWGGLWADPQPRLGTALIQDPETGEYYNVTYERFQELGLLPSGMSRYEFDQMKATGQLQPLFNSLYTGGGGGGGGGGGAVGPVYVKPDERMIREAVKGTLAALAGTVDQGQLDSLTKLYMDEHARSWTVRETEQVDPMESVKAAIRSTSEYKAIHQLRPESTDEYDWITSRQGALTRAGVTAKVSEQLGISMATVGASTQDTVTAGNISTFNQSGQQLDELKNRIRTAAYGALQLA